jgi:hypothetical protein
MHHEFPEEPLFLTINISRQDSHGSNIVIIIIIINTNRSISGTKM